ncbi:MAG: type IV secretory system conjugative DNA transfer family protein [bacterium]|nr:type IV secretory system conjugative DNA transfer family protein [bacterium]
MKNTNLIIGKAESGKTRGILLKKVNDSIRENSNLLFIDNKKEYYRTYCDKLKNNGYDVKVFNISDPSKSNGYNPLALPYSYYKKGNQDKAIELINELALEIYKEDEQYNDPFWSNSAASYFTGLVLILFKEASQEEINLGSIYSIITSDETDCKECSIIKEYLKSIDIMDPIYINLSSTEFAPVETKGSIISVMRQKLNLYISREMLLSVLCSSEIEIDKICDKTAIFIIGKVTKSAYNVLSNILINQIIYFVNENGIKFTYYFDNFESLPIVLEFNDLIENASINNSKIYVAVKDKEELLSNYGKFILSRFSSVTEIDQETNLIDIGNYNEYPIFKLEQKKFFNFKDYIK